MKTRKQYLWIYTEHVCARYGEPSIRPEDWFDKGTKPTKYNHKYRRWNLDPDKWVKVKKISRIVPGDE